MALESLLALLKSDVTHVTAVTASNYKAYGCNGTAPDGVTAVTAIAARADSVTPVTAGIRMALRRKPAPIGAVTAVTCVTSEKVKVESETRKVGADDTATASHWWLIHYPDRDPLKVACCPEATHAGILERHPDAKAAEPFTPTVRHPSAPLTASEETAIRAWLALIGETDPAIMALESLLTLLKSEVSGVSGVQACGHAALQRYPMKFAEVSGVSQSAADILPDTSDTSRNQQGYQRKPAPIGACTPDTPDTPKIINGEDQAPKVGAAPVCSGRWRGAGEAGGGAVWPDRTGGRTGDGIRPDRLAGGRSHPRGGAGLQSVAIPARQRQRD